ncbi:Thiol:disulfide interchange protein DsbD [Klebsiella pneumoniae]|nr:Thiol:disulfide interchange protein DsbD [Klebsiella pneumoniae]CAH5985846.1 Thiol:disulfide interchange protein DsbD [Klebsiella pneumoniae]
MYMVFRRLLVCLLWLWLPVSQAADSGWLRAADNQHASVRLRAQTESNGDTRLLLDVALEKGWKTYWRSPGEGGIAPAIAWHTPLEVNWRWPTPQRFDVAGISTQGYHGDVSFPMTLRGKIPPTLSGVLTLSTCSNVCILTDYPFSLDMTTPAGERFNYDFTRAMGTLPLLWGIFFAMGIGMSLPWLLIVAWPGLAQRLPRPGRWMNHLRVVLGLMMLGSALWLVSLLTIHIGRTPVLTLLVILAIALLVATAWRYRWRTALRAGALAIVVAGAVAFVAQQDGQGPRRDRVNWQPLSEQAIASALAEHKRVFIDVTADWCVTCKANKYNVLLRDDVQQALLAPDVVALRGDWSRPSADISQFLTARGSAAVPFNQIYGPELPQGQILPALLDREHLLATLSAAKGK